VGIRQKNVHPWPFAAKIHHPAPIQEREKVSLMQKPVLIVDDNPNMSALLVEMLEALSYDAVVAPDGHQALTMIGEQDFSMVITDFRMPNMTGVELLNKIKEHRPDLPVAIISGYNIEEIDDKELVQKADGFLGKPFMISEIDNLLSSLI
jgi:CheY-like chemotaxis protein